MEEGRVKDVINATRDQIIYRTEKPNYFAWGFTLFIALTASRLLSDYIEFAAVAYSAKIALEEAELKLKAQEKMNAQRMEAEEKNLAARNAEIARQQEQYQAEQKRIADAERIKRENAEQAQKKRIETCQFWNNEYNKTQLTGDKYHRDISCRAAGMSFN